MAEAAAAGGSRRAGRWSLKGATALVTGGTRGIGRAIVEELAEFGAAVHTCSRNESELRASLKEWEAKGFAVTGSVCDLSSREQRQDLIAKVSSVFNGKLNILVSSIDASILSGEDYSKIMATNLDSAYHLCQLAYPLLKASGSGSIVFISSVAGLLSIGTGYIYAATKAAVNQITKNLACEWAKDNIRSNCIAPWYIKTSLVERVIQLPPFLEIYTYIVAAHVLSYSYRIFVYAIKPA
ncbi:hypothetical protein CRG98_040002 [Punica granatum]|uniref:Tropinone reductase homolog At5g06060-like n=1 Tax=Punica granatum TaxID=22663 RepID=A0A2I0I6D1_PUNGR|nr:hypothetical protein CRG98_040002 [Punica granatum]